MYRKSGLAVVIVSAVLLGSGAMSLRQSAIDHSRIQGYMGSSALIRVQVTTDPHQSDPRVFGSNLAPASYSFLGSALAVGQTKLEFRLRVPIRVISQDSNMGLLLPGQIFIARGNLELSNEARGAALFLVRSEVVITSTPSRWARTLGSIRTHLRDLSPKNDAGSLIPGMVLGDTSQQSSQFRIAMRRCGLTHLTAVSGANFAIISLFVLWCMQWIIRTLKWRILLTAIALSGFIALVRPSPSVLRAAAMASVVLFARAVGERSSPLPALGFAIAAVVIGDPWQARDPGFALSVLATAGLLLLAPRISTWLSRFLPSAIAAALSPPMAAVVMCAPILVALSGYIGPMTVIANLLVAPVVAPITVLGFIAALASPIFPPLATILLFFAEFPAWWIASVAHWAARFPVVTFTTDLVGFILALSVLIGLIAAFMTSKKLLICSIALLLLLTWFGRWPGGDWQIANCDVGQGDSLAINLGHHRAILIDSGPDPVLVDRCLSQLGVREVSLLVLTHFHADHVEGLSGVLNHRKIRQVWISNNSDPQLESDRVKQLLGPVATNVVVRGMQTQVNSARGLIQLRVLWPNASLGSFDVLPGDGSAINNSSIALLITAPDFTLFAAGDVEPAVQSEIRDAIGKVDIYKVSHHGSLYQDEGMLERLSPAVSIISVGAGNTYGHPAPQTLALLARLPSAIYRTDISGAIAITARAHHLKVRVSNSGAWWQKVRLG